MQTKTYFVYFMRGSWFIKRKEVGALGDKPRARRITDDYAQIMLCRDYKHSIVICQKG